MKIKNKQLRLTAALAITMTLLLAGCKEKTTTSTDASSTAPVTNATADADNSGKNVRDRNEGTLTPGDQGDTPADRDITQKVRKTLVSGTNDFSMTAKNIKIVTVNGKVTLRGPVKTEAEKTGIVNIAKTVAGEGNVEDQLEVKANP
ncbi:MAG: BON domain-containing protein [Verrucomicrobiota bacterium]|nr:BON domain-containing protein [Verrucomicrobiota bacterium]